MSARVARLAAAAARVAMACLAAVPASAAPPSAPVPRAELEALQAAVDAAVSRVSRPSGLMFGRASRAYHLPGYGAFVVLAPRALPRAPRPRGADSRAFEDLLRRLDQSIAEVRDPEERRRLQETVAALRAGMPPAAPGMMMMRLLPRPTGAPADPAAMQESAEAFRREAELAMARAERDVIVRLRRSGEDLPLPPVPAVPPMPPAPAPPRPGVLPAVPPLPPLPPPGWTFDLATGPADTIAPDRLVSDVQRAIVTGLGSYRGALDLLGPDDYVVVAVDFVPRMADGARPRTVVARARKRDLAEHRAGRLTPEALHARVAFDEY